MKKPAAVHIRNIRCITDGESTRISADINGFEVWYESADAELQAVPEVFASAFLVPAMMQGGALCVDGPVSNVWKNNAAELQKLFSRWWDFPIIGIEAGDVEQQAVSGRTALFFTGGVDSFHTLLKGEIEVDELIYVFGFDVALDRPDHFEIVRRHLEAVSAACRKPLRIIKTNLREHPLIQQTGWGKSHGGALAAVAHSLADVSSVVVSSSYSRKISSPWGSHWKSDPFWSSGQMKLIHFGDRVLRPDKLSQIADDPLVHHHLRVCWKNRSGHVNCGQCEKCVRTMIPLEACGKLSLFETFPFRDQLPRMIRGVRYLQKGLLPVYEEFLQRSLSANIQKEIIALLKRSRLRLFRKRISAMMNPWSRQDET